MNKYIKIFPNLLLLTTIMLTSVLFFNFNILSVYGQNNTETTSLLPTTVKTDNGSVDIQMNSNDDFVPSDPISLFIEFRHPFSLTPLQHVNYNLEVLDSSMNTVFSQENLHTHIGQDVRDIRFNSPGNYDIKINVLGTGLEPPFDTTRSGVAVIPVIVN